MDRRSFLIGSALGVVVPDRGWAQPARASHRIGVLGLSATSDMVGPSPRSLPLRAFLSALHELGYAYGDRFVTEARGSAGHPERFPALVAELIGTRVDVIVATGAALPALKQATSTIPIVMAATSDPVRQGFVPSLGRPGGNVTGLSLQSAEATEKRLELLRELVAGNAPLAVIWNAPALEAWRAAQRAAGQRGWQLLSLEVQELTEIEMALKRAADARAGGVLVCAIGIAFHSREQIAAQAASNRLPAIYELRPFVEAGGLISYGPDLNDIWRRAANYVDKILKGANPGDLPIEQPTKFELVINAGAVRALGITIPSSILIRADEVID
jgi:putative ABC transport system substrate-binding protein